MDQGSDGGHDLAVDVVERQRGQHPVIGRELVRLLHEESARNDVLLREEAAFGAAGRARGVHQERRVAFLRGGHLDSRQPILQEQTRRIDIDHDDLDLAPARPDPLAERLGMLGVGKHQPGPRMREYVFELRGLRHQVERHRDEPAVHGAEEHRRGLAAVGAVETDPVAGCIAAAEQETREIIRLALQFTESEFAPRFRRDEVRLARPHTRLLLDVVPDGPCLGVFHYRPRLAWYSPKMSSVAGTRGGIVLTMRVVLR